MDPTEPATPRIRDPYRTLGVAREAASVDIAAAYRERREALAGKPEALAELKEAYRILSSAELRAEHDAKAVPLRARAKSAAAEETPSRRTPAIAVGLVVAIVLVVVVLPQWRSASKPAAARVSDPAAAVVLDRVALAGGAADPANPASIANPARNGATPAGPRSARDVFAAVSGSIVRVIASNGAGDPVSQGSGVVVARGEVITNCHVTDPGVQVEVKVGNDSYPASVTTADHEFDLCRLSASGLDAPAVTVAGAGDLQTGERVFAIGAPRGLELTISDGIVSSLRETAAGRIIQTTAAVSPGSSGGGLFDAQARLVGIVTFQARDGQNLNFAVPADWIGQMRSR